MNVNLRVLGLFIRNKMKKSDKKCEVYLKFPDTAFKKYQAIINGKEEDIFIETEKDYPLFLHRDYRNFVEKNSIALMSLAISILSLVFSFIATSNLGE